MVIDPHDRVFENKAKVSCAADGCEQDVEIDLFGAPSPRLCPKCLLEEMVSEAQKALDVAEKNADVAAMRIEFVNAVVRREKRAWLKEKINRDAEHRLYFDAEIARLRGENERLRGERDEARDVLVGICRARSDIGQQQWMSTGRELLKRVDEATPRSPVPRPRRPGDLSTAPRERREGDGMTIDDGMSRGGDRRKGDGGHAGKRARTMAARFSEACCAIDRRDAEIARLRAEVERLRGLCRDAYLVLYDCKQTRGGRIVDVLRIAGKVTR